MRTLARAPLSLPDLARDVDLPVHVLRRFLDRHGLVPPRKYPGQHRSIDPTRLPDIYTALRSEGYLPAEGA